MSEWLVRESGVSYFYHGSDFSLPIGTILAPSWQGSQADLLDNPGGTRDEVEKLLEQVRQEFYPEKPCRYVSIFASLTPGERSRGYPHMYKIEVPSRCKVFQADEVWWFYVWNYFHTLGDLPGYEENYQRVLNFAHRYWQSPVPQYYTEIVIEGPCRIVEEVSNPESLAHKEPQWDDPHQIIAYFGGTSLRIIEDAYVKWVEGTTTLAEKMHIKETLKVLGLWHILEADLTEQNPNDPALKE